MDLYEVATGQQVEFILFSFSTLAGDCKSCLVPTHSIRELNPTRVRLTPALSFVVDPSECNYSLLPDTSTFVALPWRKNFGWVQCNVLHNGKPFDQCPRTILERVRMEAKSLGYIMKCGIEPEFTILNKDGSDLGDPLDSKQPMSLHDPLSIMRLAPLLTNIHDVMHSLGWGPYQIMHEASSCQYEINFNFAEVLQMADRMCFFKFMTKELAKEHGLMVTFMPLPMENYLCANGLHINMSLWNAQNDEINLLPGNGKDSSFGLSKTAVNFIGGLLAHVEESCAILCPTVNSYKRLNLGSWCPNEITWGLDDKRVLLRIPSTERIEHRLADGTTNPHLALALLLASGLDGIQRDLTPPKMYNIDPCKSSILEQLHNTHLEETIPTEKSPKQTSDSLSHNSKNPILENSKTEIYNSKHSKIQINSEKPTNSEIPREKKPKSRASNANPPKKVPESLIESLQKLGQSEFVRSHLGDNLVDAFLRVKKDELKKFSAHISNWEREFYLNC